jgi:hydrogenase-4 membrane subunit HyfE
MEKWVVVWYGASSFLLGALLYLPLRKFMLAISINRHQRKTKKTITEEHLLNLKKKIYLIAAIVSMTFAFVYNRVIVFKYFGGF